MAIAAVLAVAQAVLLRLGHSLSVDEPVMVLRSRLPLGEMFEALGQNNVGPLPQLVQYVWIRAFGESEWVLRAFSALCFGTTVVVVARWGQRMAGPSASLLSSVLVATSELGIDHAATARPYALLALIVAAAGSRLCGPRSSSGASGDSAARLLDAPLITLHLAGLLTHHIYVFVLVTSAVAGAFISRRDAVRAVVAAGVAAALYLLLWGPVLWHTISLPTTGWMPTPGLVDLAAGMGRLWGVTGGVVLIVCAAAGAADNGRLVRLASNRVVAACVVLAIAPLLVAYAASAWKPVYLAARTPALVLAPASVTLGAALASLPSAILRTAMVIGLVLSAGRFTFTASTAADPVPVRAAARQLAAHARCEDVILIAGLAGPELDYYFRQVKAPACLRRVVLPAEAIAHPGWIDPDTLRFGTQIAREAEATVRSLVAEEVQRVWLVVPLGGPGTQLASFATLAVEREYWRGRSIAGSGSFFDAIVEYTRQPPR